MYSMYSDVIGIQQVEILIFIYNFLMFYYAQDLYKCCVNSILQRSYYIDLVTLTKSHLVKRVIYADPTISQQLVVLNRSPNLQ